MKFSRLFVFFLFLTLVVVGRIPFLHQPLVGEEGAFAALVVDKVPSSAKTDNGLPQMFVGAIGGQPIFYSFQRSIAPYILLENTAGTLVRSIEPNDTQNKILWSRISYFALFLAGVSLILWRASILMSSLLVSLFAFSTPLAVGASIQPQIDGSTSVLVVALGSVLVVYSQAKGSRSLAVCGGAIVAIGRPELSIAFAASAMILFAILRTGKIRTWLPLAFLAGLSVGTFVAIALSPTEYFLTFTTMKRVYGSDSSAVAAIGRAITYVWPLWILGSIATATSIYNLNYLSANRPDILLILGGSLAITAGFSVSGWSGDGFPRYFISAQIGFTICLVEISLTNLVSRWFTRACAVLSIAGIYLSTAHLHQRYADDVSITSLPGYSLKRMLSEIETSAKRSRETGQIVMEQSALWFYHPEVDFISADMGRAEAIRYLIKHKPTDLPRLAPD